MNEALYILGNGFDLAHGIKSKYTDFRDFISSNHLELYKGLQEFFDEDYLWSNFEAALYAIDLNEIFERIDKNIIPYSSPEWTDACNHMPQSEVLEFVKLFTSELNDALRAWVASIDIHKDTKYEFKDKSNFLTFNYTMTLEEIYGISSNRIKHIHNAIAQKSKILIMGFANKAIPFEYPPSLPPGDKIEFLQERDFREEQSMDIFKTYFSKRRKDVYGILHKNRAYFDSLCEIKHIYVLGHSLSDIDMPYFNKIAQKSINATWYFFFYSQTDKDRIDLVCKELNLHKFSIYPVNCFGEI